MPVETQGEVLGLAAPTKSAKSAESAAGADDESGRFIVLGLTKKTGGLDTHWAVAAMPTVGKIDRAYLCSWRPVVENRQRRVVQLEAVGENQQYRLLDEHELDVGPLRPGKKIHQGGALTKQGLFKHSRQCWNRQRRQNRQSRQNRLQVLMMSLDGL